MSNEMITKKTWEEFRDNGLLFVTNQMLHTFGYALIYNFDEDGNISEVYTARTKFRGFSDKQIEEGYKKISKYIKDNAEELEKEANE